MFQFLVVKFSIRLNKCVFVMATQNSTGISSIRPTVHYTSSFYNTSVARLSMSKSTRLYLEVEDFTFNRFLA